MSSEGQPESRSLGLPAGGREAKPDGGAGDTGFAAISRFVIANGMTADVRKAFRNRPHLVDDVPGFVDMRVLSPADCPDEIWLLTFWTDARSFREWHRSHLYHDSHAGIPAGLKLVRGETWIREFEHGCS